MGNLEDDIFDHYLGDEVPKEQTPEQMMEELQKDVFNNRDILLKDMALELKIQNVSKNDNPEYQKDGDSGFDLRASLDHHIHLEPLERKLIPTGLFFEIPLGYEIQVRPRSGLALKQGLTVLNTPGTVDRDYRGEVKIILINLSNKTVMIEPGDRIAQAVVSPVTTKEVVNITMVDKINTNTDRGSDGFGSTGKN